MANLLRIELSEWLEKLCVMLLNRSPMEERRVVGEKVEDATEQKLSSVERRDTVYLDRVVFSWTGVRPCVVGVVRVRKRERLN